MASSRDGVGVMDPMEQIVVAKRCAMCPETVLYQGPAMLRAASVWCSDLCYKLDDILTPGYWLDASEMMRGGQLHDRPDLWMDS